MGQAQLVDGSSKWRSVDNKTLARKYQVNHKQWETKRQKAKAWNDDNAQEYIERIEEALKDGLEFSWVLYEDGIDPKHFYHLVEEFPMCQNFRYEKRREIDEYGVLHWDMNEDYILRVLDKKAREMEAETKEPV